MGLAAGGTPGVLRLERRRRPTCGACRPATTRSTPATVQQPRKATASGASADSVALAGDQLAELRACTWAGMCKNGASDLVSVVASSVAVRPCHRAQGRRVSACKGVSAPSA